MRLFWPVVAAVARFAGLLLAVSLLAFGLIELSPNDPVQLQTNMGLEQDPAARDAQARAIRARLGLARPVFYLALCPADEPDTLYRLNDPAQIAACRTWLYRCGDWQAVQRWQTALTACRSTLYLHRDSVADVWIVRLGLMRTSTSPAEIAALMQEMTAFPLAQLPECQSLQQAWALVSQPRGPGWKHFVPRIAWYGSNCRYHTWLVAFLRGDWGLSYYNGQPVRDRLANHIGYTAWLAGWAVFWIFLLGTVAGTLAAARPNGRWNWLLLRLAAGLSALPSFWAGALLLSLFANPDGFADWFPAAFDPNTTGGARWLGSQWVLPLIAYSYSAWSRLALLVRASVVDALQQDFVRTARAKGASRRRVLFGHALRNSLVPLAVSVGGVLPALIGGSVVIEQLFSIPGVAPEMLSAVKAADMPVVAATVLLMGAATVAGYWLTDVLARLVDPRTVEK